MSNLKFAEMLPSNPLISARLLSRLNLVTVLLLFLLWFIVAPYKLSVFQYLAFNILYILIPGLFLYRSLSFDTNPISMFSFAFAIGNGLLILQYILLSVFDLSQLVYFINPLISLHAMLQIDKPRVKSQFSRLKNTNYNLLFFCASILVVISLFGLSLSAFPPDMSAANSYPHDKLWSVGVIQSLTNSFPPVDIHSSETTLNYHYFGFIYPAMLSSVTNIDSFYSYFFFFQPFKILFIVFATYTFGKYFFGKAKIALSFTFIFFFSTCASLHQALLSDAGKFFNQHLDHLTSFPNGYMLALTYMMLAVITILRDFKRIPPNPLKLTIFGLFCFVMSGTKAPVVAIFIGSLNLTLAWCFFCRKETVTLIFRYVIVANVIFCSVFLWLYLSPLHDTNMSPKFIVASYWRDSADIFASRAPLASLLENLKWAVAAPLFLFLYLPFSMPFASIGITKILSSTSEVKVEEMFLISGVILGAVLTSCIYFPLGGGIYFLATATPFIHVLALRSLQEIWSGSPKLLKLITVVLLSISMISSGFAALRQIGKGIVGTNRIIQPAEKCAEVKSNGFSKSKLETKIGLNLFAHNDCPGWDKITHSEFHGLIWLKRHTSPDTLLMTNRLYTSASNLMGNPVHNSRFSRYFYYSSFSERQFFLEGYHYWIPKETVRKKLRIVQKVFDPTNPKPSTLLRKNRINYLLVSTFISPHFAPDDGLKLVFESRDLKIFQVIQNEDL